MTQDKVIDAAGVPARHGAARRRQVYLTIAIILLAIWISSPFLTPLAWAAILAIAEWPLYRRADAAWPGHGALLALGFTLATALIVILPLSIAAVALASESQAALVWLQGVQAHGLAMPPWLPHVPLAGGRAADWWQHHIGDPRAANAMLGTISAASVLGWTRSIGAEVAKDSGLFLITLLALVTLLARGRQIAAQLRIVAVRMFGAFGRDFLERMTGAVRATVNGTLLVSVGEGLIIGVGYGVAGVPQPLLFATFTIVLALVPFGAWLAFGLASLILMATGHVLGGVLLFAFGATVMTIGDNFVQPSVIGSAVELPFLMALVGAFGGLATLGLIGLFVGPVVMAALLLVVGQWLAAADAPGAA